jgi:hypothetical protein
MLRTALVVTLLATFAAVAQAAAPPDYSAYQALLDQYLVRTDPGSKTSDTRFDYEKLFLDERVWRTRHSERLEPIHAALLAVHPSELSPADRTAWAINTYNFLVIERAVMRLLMPGKSFVRHRSVEDMKGADGPFFVAPVGEIEGRSCTLAEFERRYVCGDTSDVRFPRTKPADPRWSLALCSGHVGDPPLAPQAYRGATLDGQLDAAARTALAQQRFWAVDANQRRLQLSAWFVGRGADYGGSFVPFLNRYGPAELRKQLKEFQGRNTPTTLQTLPYDRKLNQAPHADAMPEGASSSSS